MKKFLAKFIKFLFNNGPPVIFLFWLENQYHLASGLGNKLQSPALGWFLVISIAVVAWLILRITLSFFSDIFHNIKNFFKGSDRFNVLKLFSKIIADVAAYFSAFFMSVRLIPYVDMVLDLIHLSLMMLVVVVLFEPGSLLVSFITAPSGGYEFLLILKIAAALYLFALILFYIIIAKFEDGLKRQVSFISSAIICLFTIDALIALLSALGATEKLPLIAPHIYGLITVVYFFLADFLPAGVAGGIIFFLISIFLYWLPTGLIHYFFFTGKISDAKSEKLRYFWLKVFLAIVSIVAIYLTAWPNRFNLRFFYWLSKLFDEKSLKDKLLIHYTNVFISGLLTAWLLSTLSQFLKPVLRLILKLFTFRSHRATAPISKKIG